MYQFFVTLLQPYPLLFLAIAVTLASLWRRPASHKRLTLLAVLLALLTAVHLPIAGNLAVGSLEWPYPPTHDRPDDIQAIVVLCGYVRPPDDFWLEAELGNDTLRRCLHAARLYHQGAEEQRDRTAELQGDRGTEVRGQRSEVRSQRDRATEGQGARAAEVQRDRRTERQEVRAADGDEDCSELLPESDTCCRPLVIVSGGKVPGTRGPSMAETMKEFLLTQGVAEEDLVLEDQALSGYENAVYCARLLAEREITRVLLVTSAVHMPRAAASFRAQGVDVTPAPCDHLTGQLKVSPQSFWPNAHAAQKFQTAAREWMGLMWYWLRGRI